MKAEILDLEGDSLLAHNVGDTLFLEAIERGNKDESVLLAFNAPQARQLRAALDAFLATQIPPADC